MPTLGRQLLALRRRIKYQDRRAVWESFRRNLYSVDHINRWKLVLSAFGGRRDPTTVVGREDRAGLEFLRAHSGQDLPEAFFVDQIYGVSRFYLGMHNGQVGHISWVFSGADPTPDIALRPGEVEIRYVYTLPEYRRSGLSRAVVGTTLSDLKQDGIGTVYAHIVPGNHASERLFTGLGFERVASVTHWRFFGFRCRRSQPQ
jgi:GNAT superfamily N-acetyltransferase